MRLQPRVSFVSSYHIYLLHLFPNRRREGSGLLTLDLLITTFVPTPLAAGNQCWETDHSVYHIPRPSNAQPSGNRHHCIDNSDSFDLTRLTLRLDEGQRWVHNLFLCGECAQE